MNARAMRRVSMVRRRRIRRGKEIFERRIWMDTMIKSRFEGAPEGVRLSRRPRSWIVKATTAR